MINKNLKFLIALVTFLVLPSSVRADDEVRKMEVDIKAKGFSQQIWQDNLDSSQIIFGPKDQFQIQFIIKNLGNRTQTQIEVKEILPRTLSVVDSQIKANQINQISFKIPQIAANENYVQTITVAVKGKDSINPNITKNEVHAAIKSEIGTASEDNLAFYTNNGTQKVKSATISAQVLPKTGSSALILGTLMATAVLAAGYGLRKYSRGY
ncbi:MAG: LPXTG cell wall anchor domain-containing protein [Candidatus Shapirobacteria bacterium]|nr:LPXTG cell wall anchor domain-containing protein [Candidatus Shapirobacteria bacterium]